MKLKITDGSIVDALIVASDLRVDEKNQIEAFSGEKFDAGTVALSLVNSVNQLIVFREEDTGKPVAIGGVTAIRPAVIQSAMLVSNEGWDKHGMDVTKLTRKVVKNLTSGDQPIRLQTICLASRKQACCWYETVGMTYESTMRGYGVNGESAVMYVKVNKARNY